jgi:CheY-like chemotaxis protein
MRILLVDDEIDTLVILSQLLELAGHTVITASNGKDGMTLAEVERPECALVDVMMPQMDGFMLCRMLRIHPATRDIPVVFITAYAGSDLDRRCAEAGGDLVLPKPVARKVLLDAIERACLMHQK